VPQEVAETFHGSPNGDGLSFEATAIYLPGTQSQPRVNLSATRRLANINAKSLKRWEVAEKKGQDMAGTTGLEPATSGVTGRRSNQLSYVPALKSTF
jgi:hypothetical protein